MRPAQVNCAGVCGGEAVVEALKWAVLEVSLDGLAVLRAEVLGSKKRCRQPKCRAGAPTAAGTPRSPHAVTLSTAPSNDDGPSGHDGEAAVAVDAPAGKRARGDAASPCAAAGPVRCVFNAAGPALVEGYVVHLRRRHDRNANVEAIKRALCPMSLVVVDAVDGEEAGLRADNPALGPYRAWPGWALSEAAVAALTFDDERAREECPMFWTRALNAGELACGISHLQVWEHALERPEVYAVLVLEDDALTTPQTVAGITKILDHLHHSGQRFDIFRFGRSSSDVCGWVEHRESDALELWHFPYKRQTGRASTARIIADVGSWTGAYALSRRALKALVACGFGQHLMNVDDFLYCCSSDRHPRRDLYGNPAVQHVRRNDNILVGLTVTMETQLHYLNITMTEAAARGNCG